MTLVLDKGLDCVTVPNFSLWESVPKRKIYEYFMHSLMVDHFVQSFKITMTSSRKCQKPNL